MMIRLPVMLAIVLFLQSCATAPVESPVLVFLQPLHGGLTVSLNENNLGQAKLLDNDGNLYSTFWELGGKKQSEFEYIVKECKKQIHDKKIFSKPRQISEIEGLEIKPSLYKEYVQCISDGGVTYVSGKAYLPDKFRLSLYRGHSRKRNYMPVGARYYLSKKDVSFSDVFQHTKTCQARILSSDDQGVKEEYFGGYIYVSIESYVEAMTSCLSGYSYKVEKVTN